MDGETMVLTLKDSSILDDKGADLNEEGDELENVNIMEQYKRDKAKKLAKKVRIIVSRGFIRIITRLL
eukprot:1189716-Prorocentrum_minimum.AAC.5